MWAQVRCPIAVLLCLSAAACIGAAPPHRSAPQQEVAYAAYFHPEFIDEAEAVFDEKFAACKPEDVALGAIWCGAFRSARGDTGGARRLFDRALQEMESDLGEGAERCRAIALGMTSKSYIGAPHERAAVRIALASSYWSDGRLAEARECLESALLGATDLGVLRAPLVKCPSAITPLLCLMAAHVSKAMGDDEGRRRYPRRSREIVQ